jgi:hypothetical protein
MEVASYVIACLYALGIAAAVLMLIYLIIKRIKDKKLEDFEKRDN